MFIADFIRSYNDIVPGFGNKKVRDFRRDISLALSKYLNIRQRAHGDTVTQFIVLKTKQIRNDDDLQTIINFFSIYPKGKSCSCSYDCCGCWQYEPVWTKEGKYKTLIAQRSYPNV